MSKASVAEAKVVKQILEVSTAHISVNTNTWLQGEVADGKTGLVTYEKSDYGFLILVQDDIVAAEHAGIPGDLHRVMKFAHSIGCEWIMLDADAPVICELESFEWY